MYLPLWLSTFEASQMHFPRFPSGSNYHPEFYIS